MKRLLVPLFAVVLLVSCGTTPVSEQFLADAQLTVTMLGSVSSAVAANPKVPVSVVNDVNAALTTMQTALNDLKASKSTPADFAKIATDVLNGVKGPVLAALGANPEIVLAVNLAIGLLPVLAADLEASQAKTPTVPTAQASNARAQAQAYVLSHK